MLRKEIPSEPRADNRRAPEGILEENETTNDTNVLERLNGRLHHDCTKQLLNIGPAIVAVPEPWTFQTAASALLSGGAV